MNKNLFYFTVKVSMLVLLLISGIINQSHSQTVLSPGDMAIVGMTTDNDESKIVTLVDLDVGTQFSITDNFWDGTAFCTSEMALEFTVSCNPIPAGTVIYISGAVQGSVGATGTLKDPDVSCGAVISWKVTCNGSAHGFGFDGSGDNLFLFQGPFNGTSSTITFLHALLSNNPSTTLTCGSDKVDDTRLTNTGLTVGTNAIKVSNPNHTRTVNCSSVNGTTASTIFTQINTVANWSTSDGAWDASAASCAYNIGVDCSKIVGSCISCTASNTLTNASKQVPANTITWTNASVLNVLVVAWENTAAVGAPTNGSSYTASTTFTSGSLIGSAGHVVYKGSSTKIGSAITGFAAVSDPVNYAVFQVVTNCGGAATCYVPSSSNCLSSLPVRMVYQFAVKEEDKYVVEWSTASEINSAYYEIEASLDGIKFVSIKQYQTKDNTSALSVYQASFYSSENYPYVRIKQVDTDGRYEYYDVMLIQEEISDSDFEVFPVPATDNLFIRSLSSAVTEKNMVATYSISSIVGNVLEQSTFDLSVDHVVKPLSVEGFDVGTYLLTIQLSDRKIVKRFVVQ
ncbi:MAG TPA: T9SS type A sorting domain-containing protein [Cytophagaceae bacterium]|nr:T9SS type A sorting domain-containing protein [Cytophagaceae bacterium]